ncbi:MAG: GGDEF domain-containing protein [Candidatus Thiodiazotropha lotti]|uniref:diguanylate cyclase n=1 Tax=Candidatus Thiodiazotropha endoloripes TaxID=1818881 RepID=A0A1E2UHL8_9GAMM|nr:GGDEF domain-containing protein [Candidatus Thiodiazotropha endoloripes]MCG7899650.1 GGDEF domain-containing protein [Candidatus Thiodiazotropha weberae]MCG7993122.1 GGDEF domain-containing protein [Candidatus Thiodiazotropha lotti]MCG8000257.1 GGDEF domain-containing protein [Candidatus Thiodiazotropha lotti]MCW4184784.1 GGDEF domain-containing protein [Candidatus Thiodiazotropha weberae]MCW4192027.1 GGDEF domain-containing protein [Candidatus Thiodiazotropha weberae]
MRNLTSLRLQAYKDLVLRARGGIIIYLVVWLIPALWVGMQQRTPLIFYANTLLFVVVALARSIHYLRFKKDPSANPNQRYRVLVGLILFSALHWGGVSAWVVYGSPYEELHYPYMIILAAFALGGTAILSISFFTSILYPLLIYVPTISIGLIFFGDEDHMLAVLALFSTIYVIEAARVSRRDYWTAIKSKKEAEERAVQLEKVSATDPLTGLYNRLYFNDHFVEEWSRCSRLQIPLGLLMIDIDHFKSINDRHGHLAGDACLKEVSLALRKKVQRITDTVVRFGGEEFVILLPNTDETAAATIAQSLLHAISEITPTWGEGSSSVNCSIGLACIVPDHHKTRESLLRAADAALYQAKSQGRNRYCAAKL